MALRRRASSKARRAVLMAAATEHPYTEESKASMLQLALELGTIMVNGGKLTAKEEKFIGQCLINLGSSDGGYVAAARAFHLKGRQGPKKPWTAERNIRIANTISKLVHEKQMDVNVAIEHVAETSLEQFGKTLAVSSVYNIWTENRSRSDAHLSGQKPKPKKSQK